MAGDGVHPSAKGAAAIAEVLADLDHEPVAPKKKTIPIGLGSLLIIEVDSVA
jgi:hypothetical protein